jgi:glutaconate CoA-transferase subunit A
VAQVNSDPVEGMRAYLEKHVFEPSSWNEYLSLIGLEELLASSGRGRSIYND